MWLQLTIYYNDWFEVDLLDQDIAPADVISVSKAHTAP